MPWCSNQAIAASKLISTRSTVQKRSTEARVNRRRLGNRHAAICEDLKHDESIAASLARVSGMNQIIVLPVIDNAVLKAVLAWYL